MYLFSFMIGFAYLFHLFRIVQQYFDLVVLVVQYQQNSSILNQQVGSKKREEKRRNGLKYFKISSFQNEVAVNYMKATNFMMLGGLMLAACVEHSGLHRRIALRIVLMLGTSPKMSMFVFILTLANLYFLIKQPLWEH